MRYINRELKGTKGYIGKQRLFELIKTLILFAMALGIFYIGLATLHTKKSLWSVFAVLALLPACKSLVGFIMFARFDSLADDVYEVLSSSCKSIPAIYENILTTSDKTYFVPVICCIGGSVIGYGAVGSDRQNHLKDHLVTVCRNAGHEVTVRIFEDISAFSTRVETAAANLTPDKRDEDVIATIRSVSL